ncbi:MULTISPECIES: GlxA family transcriptional regulator [unclassified Agarivorans]|uniref:GlxA family transcriptional regulator n=1 Tax=unclassified Agarivorans TaxID=2636026 RepID=UPI0026E21556|nr:MULTISPECIES: helix-turn-helix domain-containing protein [unclassified Agarivorans]MDO6686784.1 helix-turn-helix domain-containing protein [Agarivorans sp. 3_MG-2023]MDO6716486.1 helix-turn-helix domain-containing protein [Agarivorans sp. 2_MG-2023]
MKAAILLMDNCFGTGINGILDALIAANYSLIKSGAQPLFEWELVSLDGNSVRPTNGLRIDADCDLASFVARGDKPDIWIIPGIYQSASNFGKVQAAMQKSEVMVPVLQQHMAEDKMIVCMCTGAFLLAQANLLGKNPALMHWRNEHHFRQAFPTLTIDSQNTIAEYHNLLCSIGGSMAYEYLVLRLIGRFAGHQTAINTAKLLMMDLNAPPAAPYRATHFKPEHQDALVQQAQLYLQRNSSEELNMVGLAEELNISDRQLKRRFAAALACSPLQYLQQVRVNQACNLLEATQLPSSKIVLEVGYKDESSFRRLFKKQMAMTMETYRQQFGIMAHSISA